MKQFTILQTNLNQYYTNKLSQELQCSITQVHTGVFSDGELSIELTESVYNKEVIIYLNFSGSINDSFMEFLFLCDAARRSGAQKIIGVIPYLPYARQERRTGLSPISARVIADMIERAQVDHLITFELHSQAIEGFFKIPVTNIRIHELFLEKLSTMVNPSKSILVSPDVGGTNRVSLFANLLKCDFAIMQKFRPKANDCEMLNIIGDVKGKDCYIIDDLCDTGKSLVKCAQMLKDHGAQTIYAVMGHSVFSGKALDLLKDSPIKKTLVSNSLKPNFQEPTIEVYDLIPLISKTLKRNFKS